MHCNSSRISRAFSYPGRSQHDPETHRRDSQSSSRSAKRYRSRQTQLFVQAVSFYEAHLNSQDRSCRSPFVYS